MILEKEDLAALRLSEERGPFPTAGELAQAGLSVDDFERRLDRLKAGAVIRSFRTVLVVPPFLGGNWVWAAVLANVARPLGAASSLTKRLPFVTEVILNSGLPEGLGPNLAFLFYSRDFDTEAKFIRSTSGMEHHEVYRVAEYSFPIALPVSSEERALLKHLAQHPDEGVSAAARAVGKDEDWVRVKLGRLTWTEVNRTGVMRILPEVDWSRVENFGHFHFLVETGHKPDVLERAVAERGFKLVLAGDTYRERYVQVEADVWGIADLMDRVAFLNQITGVRVAGVVWNQRTTANSDWVSGLLG